MNVELMSTIIDNLTKDQVEVIYDQMEKSKEEEAKKAKSDMEHEKEKEKAKEDDKVVKLDPKITEAGKEKADESNKEDPKDKLIAKLKSDMEKMKQDMEGFMGKKEKEKKAKSDMEHEKEKEEKKADASEANRLDKALKDLAINLHNNSGKSNRTDAQLQNDYIENLKSLWSLKDMAAYDEHCKKRNHFAGTKSFN